MDRRQLIKRVLGLIVIVLIGYFFLSIPRLLIGHENMVEVYSRNIFPWISKPVVYLSSQIPFSITEAFLIFAALTVIFGITWIIAGFVRSKRKGRYLYRTALTMAILFAFISVSFTLMLGINYMRAPISHVLPAEKVPTLRGESVHNQNLKRIDNLTEVCLWLAKMSSETRAELPEDDNGNMILTTDLLNTLAAGSSALDQAAVEFPVLTGNTVEPKGVALSHLWSYTGILGTYSPFLGEANINVDTPAFSLPVTICHEISHVRGIAREQDANMAAFLACISSDRLDFRYSGYAFAYLYCASDLAKSDRKALSLVNQKISDGTRRDWQQDDEYWQQFEGPVQEVTNEINNSYLQANQQPEGVLSYNQITDLIIRYYFNYVKENKYDLC